MPRRIAGAALVAVLAVTVAAGDAKAQRCADEIALLAQQYALTTDLPKPPADLGSSSGSMGVAPEDLARSGGVIAPPEGARGRVFDPPRQDDPMVTTPEVRPQTQNGRTEGSRGLDAAKRAQMQSLLDAAREADRNGNEAECLARVARARAIPAPG